MTTLNEKVLQLNQLTKSFDSLQNQKNNLQSTILEDFQYLINEFYQVWKKINPDITKKLDSLIETNCVTYSSNNLDAYSQESILFFIGNFLPLYNESCEFINEYEITDSSGDVSVIKEKNHLKFIVSYANQDGFEFIISENLLSHMYQPDWNKHLTDYVSKTLDEAFTKVQSEFIPLMSPVLIPKKTKMTKTELEKQAQMLGYKLVKN